MFNLFKRKSLTPSETVRKMIAHIDRCYHVYSREGEGARLASWVGDTTDPFISENRELARLIWQKIDSLEQVKRDQDLKLWKQARGME